MTVTATTFRELSREELADRAAGKMAAKAYAKAPMTDSAYEQLRAEYTARALALDTDSLLQLASELRIARTVAEQVQA